MEKEGSWGMGCIDGVVEQIAYTIISVACY